MEENGTTQLMMRPEAAPCEIPVKPFQPALSHLSHPSCGAGHGRQGVLLDITALVDMTGRRDALSLLSHT